MPTLSLRGLEGPATHLTFRNASIAARDRRLAHPAGPCSRHRHGGDDTTMDGTRKPRGFRATHNTMLIERSTTNTDAPALFTPIRFRGARWTRVPPKDRNLTNRPWLRTHALSGCFRVPLRKRATCSCHGDLATTVQHRGDDSRARS